MQHALITAFFLAAFALAPRGPASPPTVTHFQTKEIDMACDYNHIYDVSLPALRGFNTALGTLVAVHFDLTVDAPYEYGCENTSTAGNGYAYFGYTPGATYFDPPVPTGITSRIELYWIFEPPCGDGTELLLGDVSCVNDSFTVVLQPYDGTTDYAGGSGYLAVGSAMPNPSVTVDDVSVLTDSGALCYFAGNDKLIRLKDRALLTDTLIFEGYSDSEFYEPCINAHLTVRYEYK